ncbi:tRNA (adenosine(37)-N6)-threonylcarbamoyltransferase complex ATPase subunit type 1 TsaE [Alloscardovia macacae]|uniref:tRNA threonylcarbamoyladenosine biosynthesis protein TsaE n=1 Tax=Alloscardovia macacae TaxID=1160091 RepID=A0A1Y2SXB8_9BIFI|nr:tRNA (adenosine(37)-N6)-threonylcarbamoyltransferase complex ATPase subunit type 1 TsaE [Alloscardovia macacae]OTA27324.1 tRNA (adenosine(37)-N6)-threonylcarbamoyltransferase complex ATPase subunit type 1 TsaE [Alloscardovia macacae]OTA28473.1 tRNA (adenosine(37)-N6)-threonylcarbamoyltransferase complex ATPase subunit type 1 TsaE [Alloscardovia macacae]
MTEGILRVDVPTAEDMQHLGELVAGTLHGSDVVVLSGPLGAGKTTFTQGIGTGLQIDEPVVSPTFTIAREMDGRFSGGLHAHLVHVDAYRLPGSDNDDAMYTGSENAVNRLLDELESLGLDEILEAPDDDTVILIEWGSMMASVLAPERLEIDIDRSVDNEESPCASDELTSNGTRRVTLRAVGLSWQSRLESIAQKW